MSRTPVFDRFDFSCSVLEVGVVLIWLLFLDLDLDLDFMRYIRIWGKCSFGSVFKHWWFVWVVGAFGACAGVDVDVDEAEVVDIDVASDSAAASSAPISCNSRCLVDSTAAETSECEICVVIRVIAGAIVS
jgi:hypothetical protein